MTDRPASEEPAQRVVRHYRLIERVGAGGIGVAYRGRDIKLGRTVLVKAVSADITATPERRDALLRDARQSARLSHPNIATLYEIVEDGPEIFLVFDFAAGESLRTMLGGQPLNPRRAVDLAVQIADALADAHADGVVHGDLKPDNIIVTPRGNPRILDFGLSAWTRGGAARRAAAGLNAADAATVLGTLAYLSPEQALGDHGDARTDIFSLGVLLHEMLTGKLPFNGSTAEAMTLQIAQAPVPVVSAATKALPTELDAILSRALSKSLAGRYESAAALGAELRGVAAILDVRATVAAEQAGPVGRPAGPRRGIGLWLLAAAVIALLAAAVYWWSRGLL